MTFEPEQQLTRLEAENKRLKRVMKRMYQGVWGIQQEAIDGTDTFQTGYLPLQISSVFISNQPFVAQVDKVLELLGNFFDASRIYIFENFADGTRFKNTFEWCNEGVSPQIDHLNNLSYADFSIWKELLLTDGFIKASNVSTQLPHALQEILEAQSIQSILVYPLFVQNEYFGFIGLDECSFHREWLPHEMDIMQMSARLTANAFESQFVKEELSVHDRSQAILLEISHLLGGIDHFESQVSQTLEKLALHFQVSRAFLFENRDGNAFCSNTFEYCQPGVPSFKEKWQNLDYHSDLPGWLSDFETRGHYNSDASTNNESGKVSFF